MRAGWSRAMWLFPLATTLHNLEEAIGLPAWSQHTRLHAPVGAFEFRFAVIVLTLLAWLVAWRAARGGVWRYLAAGYCVAMLLNVVFPHVAATVIERGYTPGVVTALGVNLPIDGYLVWRGLRDGELRARGLAIAGAGVTVALVAAIPVLFAIGRAIG